MRRRQAERASPSVTTGPSAPLPGGTRLKIIACPKIIRQEPAAEARNPGCRVASAEGGLSMQIHSFAAHHASELDQLGDEIAELSAHLDAASARLLTLIREFDARGGWNTGFRSCAAWLSWRVGLDLGAARERVRVARALGSLPLLAEALGRGQLSYAKVRALTRVATPETEARLLAVGRAGTAAPAERFGPGWAAGGPGGRGDRAPACQQNSARPYRRGRHGRGQRAARAGGRSAADAGPARGPRDPVQARPSAGRGGH